jgi:transcriptional regulator with XRE-family HTH domain
VLVKVYLGLKPSFRRLDRPLLTTGNQLKAGRALIGMEQAELASRAKLNVNTIQNMERAGSGPIAGRAANVQTVQAVLEAAGVEFLNSDRPGVRLKREPPNA